MGQELFAQSEVCEHDMAGGVEQNVLQLDVSVDDAQLEHKQQRRVQNKYISPLPSATLSHTVSVSHHGILINCPSLRLPPERTPPTPPLPPPPPPAQPPINN